MGEVTQPPHLYQTTLNHPYVRWDPTYGTLHDVVCDDRELFAARAGSSVSVTVALPVSSALACLASLLAYELAIGQALVGRG